MHLWKTIRYTTTQPIINEWRRPYDKRRIHRPQGARRLGIAVNDVRRQGESLVGKQMGFGHRNDRLWYFGRAIFQCANVYLTVAAAEDDAWVADIAKSAAGPGVSHDLTDHISNQPCAGNLSRS